MSRLRGGGWATLVALTVLIVACSGGETEPEVSLGTLPGESSIPATTADTGATTVPATTAAASTTAAATTTMPSPSSSAGDSETPTGAEGAWKGFWAALPDPRPDGVLRGPATPQAKQAVSRFIYGPNSLGPITRVETFPVLQGQGAKRQVTDCILTQPPLSGQPNRKGFLVRGTVENRPNGWRVTDVNIGVENSACAPAALVDDARTIWVRDLELELGLPESLPEMKALETEELFASTSDYADEIRDAGGTYQGERQLNPVVSGISFDDAGRIVITLRSCHTYGDNFGVVADGEMLTDLYNPDVRRSDVGEVTRFEDGWRVSAVEGSRRPCEPGDGVLEVVDGG